MVLICHCLVIPGPEDAMVNEELRPTHCTALVGCVVIVANALTVRVAVLLVTEQVGAKLGAL